ncbi:hypothetical protein, partial [Neolewinella agarilytica]|uniref:hypothetical protein n=1 Tax=Neolewinella agarilytica TaxID=478744 RepID=UPI002354B8B6
TSLAPDEDVDAVNDVIRGEEIMSLYAKDSHHYMVSSNSRLRRSQTSLAPDEDVDAVNDVIRGNQ